jgi:cbb3-type cytochrome oxidase subunit 3
MTKTKIVSLRIPVESYRTIMDECKKKGITMTEWYERKIALAKQRIPKPIPETIPEPIIIKEKASRASLLFTLLFLVLFIGVSIVCFNYSKENKGITQKYEKTMDSLNNELFIKQIEADRYKVALELFKEEDSVAADKFHFILVTKTE